METITDRIKYLVDTLARSKAEFGRRIGVSGASVSNLYHGKTKPDGSTVTAICSVFGVNRAWLEQGEGEPFKVDEIDTAIKEKALPSATKTLVRAFESLTETEQCAVLRFVQSWADSIKEEEAVEEFRREYRETKKGTTSSPSSTGTIA